MEYYDLDQTQKEHKHAEAQRLPRGAVGAACINDKTEYLVNTSTNFCTLFTPHKPARNKVFHANIGRASMTKLNT